MIKRITACLCACLLCLQILPVRAASTIPIRITGTYKYSLAYEVAALVNQERAALGLQPLILDEELTEAAMVRAPEANLWFDHTRPDGTSCFTASSKMSGENLAAGSTTAAAVVEQWKSSPGHWANITNAIFRSIGVGCFDQGRVPYWVQTFSYEEGTPAGKKADVTRSVSIQNLPAHLSLSLNHSSPVRLDAGQKETVSVRTGNDTGYLVCELDPANFAWSSSDSRIVSVDGNGTLTGAGAGKASITASLKVMPSLAVNFQAESSAASVTMHRLYNPNSGEHFYTADTNEKNHLVSVGWQYEGTGWKAPVRNNTPVHRLYNPNAGDHHYTMDVNEKNHLVSVGWRYEGVGWYSDDAKAVPLYRQYNPNAKAGSHNYTTNKAENDHLVRLGWKAEGIGWYGLN